MADVFPRSRSPYIEHDLFLFAPAVYNVNHSAFSFSIDSNLFYTNTGKTINTLEIDLGLGGGYISAQFNQNVPVSYDSSGVKNIKIKVSYTDGSIYYSHFDISAIGSSVRSYEVLPDLVHYITPIDLPEDNEGRGGGTINVFLGFNHTRIEKPFI